MATNTENNQFVLPEELEYALELPPLDFTKEQILEVQNWVLEQLRADKLEFVLRTRQIQALISFILKHNDIACFLPTGYGKTIIALLCAIYMWQTKGKKTIYIGMLRALAAEMAETFAKRVPTLLDMGGDNKTLQDYENEDWVIACLTPEKFKLLMQNKEKNDYITENVGLIIVDEAHNIGDKTRGRTMESHTIKCWMANPEFRYIYLSATVGNPEEFSEWLKCDLIIASPEERPVPLNLEIIPYKEKYYAWAEKKGLKIPDINANFKIRAEIIKGLVRDSKYADRVWLFFATSRDRAEKIIGELSGIRRNSYEKDASYLDRLIAEGYAFHHAGIPEDHKAIIEEGLRNGSIRFCGATPTLAVGVNVFANCSVLMDCEQYDEVGDSDDATNDSKFTVIDPNRTQQTGGRAGRPVVICPKCGGNVEDNVCQSCAWENIGYFFVIPPERLEEKMRKYATEPLKVVSHFREYLHAEILSFIEDGTIHDLLDILDLCEYSFADISEEEAYNSIAWLKTFGFIQDIDGEISNTQIGSTTAIFGVEPESVVIWQAQICNIQNPNDLNEIFTRFASVREYYKNTTVRKQDEALLEIAEGHLGHFFPSQKKVCGNRQCLTCAISKECLDKEYKVVDCENFVSNLEEEIKNEVLKCFGLSFSHDIVPIVEKWKPYWVNGKKQWQQIKEPAVKLLLSDGDVKIIKEAGSRIFAAAAAIFRKNKALVRTLKLLEVFCKAGTLRKELVPLCCMKRIGYAKAQALYAAGIKTPAQFGSTPNEEIRKIQYTTSTGKKMSIGSLAGIQKVKVLNALA